MFEVCPIWAEFPNMAYQSPTSVSIAPAMKNAHPHISGLIVFAATAWVGSAPIAAAQDELTVRNFGTEVVNVATMSYTAGEARRTVGTGACLLYTSPSPRD